MGAARRSTFDAPRYGARWGCSRGSGQPPVASRETAVGDGQIRGNAASIMLPGGRRMELAEVELRLRAGDGRKQRPYTRHIGGGASSGDTCGSSATQDVSSVTLRNSSAFAKSPTAGPGTRPRRLARGRRPLGPGAFPSAPARGPGGVGAAVASGATRHIGGGAPLETRGRGRSVVAGAVGTYHGNEGHQLRARGIGKSTTWRVGCGRHRRYRMGMGAVSRS
jgi:hypothetical protein